MSKLHLFSNSERTDYLTCRRKHWLRWPLGLKPKEDPNVARLGSLWSEIMDSYWPEVGSNEVRPDNARATCAKLTESRLEAVPRGFHPNYSGPTSDEIEADYELLSGILEGYHSTYGEDWEYTTLGIEEYATAPTFDHSGRVSDLVGVSGRFDKRVRDPMGGIWIPDHKLTGHGLDSWMRLHNYQPQAPTYAYIARHAMGEEIQGFIYDLAWRKVPPKPSDYSASKSSPCRICGKGANVVAHKHGHDKFAHAHEPTELTKERPAGTTVYTLLEALEYHDIDPWTCDPELQQLGAQEDPYFRREIYRFTPEETDNTTLGRELYEVGRGIREVHEVTNSFGGALAQSLLLENQKSSPIEYLVEMHARHSARNPRNGAACYKYNRPCKFMDFCRYGNADGLRNLIMELPGQQDKPYSDRDTIDLF